MAETAIKVLIVEDEESILDYEERTLARRGYLVFGAMKGMQAIEIFEKERPDICLIDVSLADVSMDGIDVLKRIKEIKNDTVCIMLTRINDSETSKKAKDLGALHYFLKPISVEELKKIADEAAEVVREQRNNTPK